MALKKKNGPTDTVKLLGKISDTLPKVPDAVKDRFPEMTGYEEQMRQWWMDAGRVIREQMTGMGAAIDALKIEIENLKK